MCYTVQFEYRNAFRRLTGLDIFFYVAMLPSIAQRRTGFTKHVIIPISLSVFSFTKYTSTMQYVKYISTCILNTTQRLFNLYRNVLLYEFKFHQDLQSSDNVVLQHYRLANTSDTSHRPILRANHSSRTVHCVQVCSRVLSYTLCTDS